MKLTENQLRKIIREAWQDYDLPMHEKPMPNDYERGLYEGPGTDGPEGPVDFDIAPNTGNEFGSGEQLVEFMIFMGLDPDDGIDMVYSTLSGFGAVDGLAELQKQLRRRLTLEELKMLIDLLNKDGWIQ